MQIRRRVSMAVPLALLVALAQGCGDDVTGPGMVDLAVQLTITGNSPDPDGATVSLDGGPERSIMGGQFLDLGQVLEGSHVISLGGLASNCQVMGENPRIVTVHGAENIVAFEASCSTPVDDGTTLWSYLNDVGSYVEGDPVADTVDQGTTLEEKVDGLWSCTVRRVSMEQYPDDYATFNPNAEVIYPGSMLQGATLVDATPEPVVVARAGGTVVINLVNGSSGVYQHVDQVKQSTVIQAINDILAENTGIGAARFTFNSSEVQSREELAMSLGVNVSTLSADFSSNLAFSRDREYNRFLVRLNQSYYTVSFDLPLSLSDLFAPTVTPADLDRYVGPGNPPAYISSVTYGRTFFLLIESTASASEMRASIHASYDAAVVDGSMDAEATYVKDLANVNIKVFALGGDQSLAAANFNGDLSALGDFLTVGADIRTGVPLSYVVRNVLDNTIVNVKVATDYDIKTCVPVIMERLASYFDTDGDGWTAYGNSRGIEYSSTCGPSGDGCIHQLDATSERMQFRAPLEWTDGKSWLAFQGGTIGYYITHSGGSYLVPSTQTEGIVIEGKAGMRIAARLPDHVVAEAHGDWTKVEYYLTEDGTDFGSGQVVKWIRENGQEATDDDIREVLESVTDFRILADLYYDWDRTYLDNVEVTQADSTSVGVGMGM